MGLTRGWGKRRRGIRAEGEVTTIRMGSGGLRKNFSFYTERKIIIIKNIYIYKKKKADLDFTEEAAVSIGYSSI